MGVLLAIGIIPVGPFRCRDVLDRICLVSDKILDCLRNFSQHNSQLFSAGKIVKSGCLRKGRYLVIGCHVGYASQSHLGLCHPMGITFITDVRIRRVPVIQQGLGNLIQDGLISVLMPLIISIRPVGQKSLCQLVQG